MGFCVSLSRTGLIIFNTLFFLGGLAILITGSVFAARGNSYGISAPTSIGIIVMGAIVMVISLLGLFGALKRVKFLIWVYFVLLLLILGAQIAIAVIAYTDTTLYTNLIATAWNESASFAEQFQTTFTCCNVTNGAVYNLTNGNPCTYNVTCNSAMTTFYNEYYNAVMIAAAVLAAIEVFGLLFSLVMGCSDLESGSHDMEMK